MIWISISCNDLKVFTRLARIPNVNKNNGRHCFSFFEGTTKISTKGAYDFSIPHRSNTSNTQRLAQTPLKDSNPGCSTVRSLAWCSYPTWARITDFDLKTWKRIKHPWNLQSSQVCIRAHSGRDTGAVRSSIGQFQVISIMIVDDLWGFCLSLFVATKSSCNDKVFKINVLSIEWDTYEFRCISTKKMLSFFDHIATIHCKNIKNTLIGLLVLVRLYVNTSAIDFDFDFDSRSS